MDIKSCLAIEETHSTTINLILTGSFAKVYNQSFYLLTEVLGKPLKAHIKYVKSAGNRFVVSGGFPFHSLEKNYPQAKRCEWGYQIKGEFNTDGYIDWLLQHEVAAQAGTNGATAAGSVCPQPCVQAEPANGLATVYTTSVNLSLSPQQANYLLNWQRGNYPAEMDFGFIESLKPQLPKIEPSSD